MAIFDSPDLWTTPDWHPDYGDARAELEHLRDFAKAVHRSIGTVQTLLEIPEPGLMYVVISKIAERLAEVYSIPATETHDQQKYGIFLFPGSVDEQERYFRSVAEAVDFLRPFVHVSRGDEKMG